MIKMLNIPEDRQKKIVSWLYDEISGDSGVLSLRGEKEDQWAKWTRNFEATPQVDIKTFPFEYASNLVAPIQSITVNAFVARQYNTMLTTPTLWSVKALSSQWADHAMPTENFLNYVQRYEMKMRKNITPWLYDMANLGLGVAKIPWAREVRQGKRYKADGSLEAYENEVSNGARFIPIPRADFIYPHGSEQDIQKMQWIDHRFRLRWGVVEARGKRGTYMNVDDVRGHYVEQFSSVEDETERLTKEWKKLYSEEYEFHEVWCFCDFDDDGYEEHCVFTVNFDAMKMVRATLIPFNHGKRPFIATQCFPRAHHVDGIGFGQKLERLQEGLTAVVNQGIDNATIANTRAFIARRGSGIKPGTKIYTGKVFMVDDVERDLKALAMGDVYGSIQALYTMIVGLSERATGISDYHLGRESQVAGSAATATSTLALIQEGSKLFDFLLKNERIDMSEVAHQTYSLYAQFKPLGLAYSLLGEDGALIEETWEAIGRDATHNLQMELTATSPHVNKALERESWVQLFNLILGYYNKLFDVSNIMLDPQAPPELRQICGKMVMSAHMIMERVLERWDLVDADRALVNPEDIVSLALQGGENVTGGGAPVSAGAGGLGSPTDASRLGGLSEFIGGAAGGLEAGGAQG